MVLGLGLSSTLGTGSSLRRGTSLKPLSNSIGLCGEPPGLVVEGVHFHHLVRAKMLLRALILGLHLGEA